MGCSDSVLCFGDCIAGMLSRYSFGFEKKGGGFFGYSVSQVDGELLKPPFYYFLSGRVENDEIIYLGYGMYLWTSSAEEHLDYAHYLTVNIDVLFPTFYFYRHGSTSLCSECGHYNCEKQRSC